MAMELRKAKIGELDEIWKILQFAIEQRRLDGSSQWQKGYPNRASVQHDFEKDYAYVLMEGENLLGYAAIIFDEEPAYTAIEGKWLSEGPYMVVHRVAAGVKGKQIGTNLFRLLEKVALEHQIYSIKVDTNFDNAAMLSILEKLGYTYCGEVYFRGSARRAFEKLL